MHWNMGNYVHNRTCFVFIVNLTVAGLSEVRRLQELDLISMPTNCLGGSRNRTAVAAAGSTNSVGLQDQESRHQMAGSRAQPLIG
jgi:hypothetical protein